jgi:HSP20 family protein
MNAVAEHETQTQAQAKTPTAAPQPATPDRYVAPRVNIAGSKDGYVLEIEMPGVNKDGLTVDLTGNILTLVGRRQPRTISGNLVYRESPPAAYRRAYELAPDIDTARISAHIDQGVLTVQLPKAEKAKPRRIQVN